MTVSIATQIQAFRDEVVYPAFMHIKAEIENPETAITIVKSREGTADAVAGVVRQMHSDTPYLGSATSDPSSSQTWIVASVYVEILQNPESDAICLGQYCLSTEINIAPTQQVQVTLIVGHSKGKGRHNHLDIEPKHQPIDLENIYRSDLFQRFFESFENFERQLPKPELSMTQAPLASESTLALDLYFNEPSLTPPNPEASPSSPDEAQPEPTPFTNPQILYDLSKQLTQTLAPSGFPITSQFNPKLQHSAKIKPIQDRYQCTIDLSLEYSPVITETELTEYLHRLGHYQTLRHLAHLHIFIQEQIQAWFKQHGQPSVGAIAPHLHQHIIELRDNLYQRIQTHTDKQLDSTAQTLQNEQEDFSTQQQNQQTLLDQLDKAPLLGYLDVSLLDTNTLLMQPIEPFTDPIKSIDIFAQHLTSKNGRLILSHITPCHSDKYKAYRQRRPEHSVLKLITEYTITQKLYPQRPIFIGAAPRPVYPRLELLWGEEDDSTTHDPLTQIWRIYPMMRTDPPQWLIVAATTDTQPLKPLVLKNGQIAQEGSYEYLHRALEQMAQSEDEYGQALSKLVTEALECRRIKYLHIHQTQDFQTKAPRDILQMQFQLFR